MNVQQYAEALLNLPEEWKVLPYDSIRQIFYKDQLLLCSPDMPPIIMQYLEKDDKWEPTLLIDPA